MVEESPADKMAELMRAVKPLMDSIPQPTAGKRLAGLVQVAGLASGLDKNEIAEALAMYLTLLYQEYAEIIIHHKDGTREQFVIGPDFHYDVRPVSPYYDGQDESA